MTVRACEFCRQRKIRCDSLRPTCSTCANASRECSYRENVPRPRPSMALLNASRKEKEKLESILIRLKSASGDERSKLLSSLQVVDGELSLPADDQLVDTAKQEGTLAPFAIERR